MLRILQFEEIQSLLLQVPKLVNKLEARDPAFAAAVKTWVTRVEETLGNNRLAITADVAALRGTLISAERGLIPEGIRFHGRATARKIKDATAADVLQRAEAIVLDSVRADMERFYEGEHLARQIVTVAQAKGLIASRLSEGGHVQIISAIWQAILADADLGRAALRLAGLVGSQDALILVDRMLPELV